MPAPLRTTLLGILAVAGCSDPGVDPPGTGGDDDAAVDGNRGDASDPDPDAGVDATPPDAPPDIDAAPPIDAPTELSVCPSSAYPTIGSAIAAVAPGGTVRVCGGTYAERITIMGKAVNLISMDGADATIIDGGAAGSVLTVDAADGVVVEGFTLRNGSATHGGGVLCSNSRLRIGNSTITGNRASVEGGGIHTTACELDLDLLKVSLNRGGAGQGGGLALRDSSGAVHASNIFDNSAEDGGGAAVFGGTVVLADNMFRANAAVLQGGGLWHSSDAMVAGNTFENNTAGWTGGGIYVDAHNAVFAMNTVRGSVSQNDGGGIYVHQGAATFRGNHILENTTSDDGGGLRLFENRSLVENNIIENNTAGDAGGGIRVSHIPALFMNNIVRNNDAMGTGGGMDMDNDASTVIGGEISGNHAGGSGGGIFHWLGPWNGAVLIGIRFTDNSAWRGGAIFLDDNFKPVTMRGLIFDGNHAGRGGALHVRATDWTLRGALFVNNRAPMGGAIYHGANSPWWEECTPMFPCPPTNPTGRIDFSTFHGNEGDDGAALWVDAPNLIVSNSIFTDSDGPSTVTLAQPAPEPAHGDIPEMPRPFPTVTWRYNNASPSAFVGMEDPSGSNGNLSASACYVDAATGDFHLAPGCACIDHGDPAISDPDGSRSDMGMFGGPPQ